MSVLHLIQRILRRIRRLFSLNSANNLPKKGRRNSVGTNSIFSVMTPNYYVNQLVVEFLAVVFPKIQPHYLSLEYMAIPELPYISPRLVKGKRIESVPKCNTLAKEEARQN
jgi:hypothetical protein